MTSRRPDPNSDRIADLLYEPEDDRTDEEREDDLQAAITELKHRKLWAQAREKERTNEIRNHCNKD